MATLADQKTPLSPGTLLYERYLIVKSMSSGDASRIYQAKDRRFGDRLCAIWELTFKTETAEQRVRAAEEFERKAQLLTTFNHPAIPSAFDYFIDGGRYYVAFQCVPIGNLADQFRIRGGRIDELTATRWAIQICDVLDYLHTRSPAIVHRNITPRTVMLDDRRGKVILLDFEHALFGELRTGLAAGSEGYAPPELYAGRPEPASDLYSLGATLFFLLTGADPQDDPLLVFDFSTHPKPGRLNPMLSEQMETIVMQLVERYPNRRPASARVLKAMLEQQEQQLLGAEAHRGAARDAQTRHEDKVCPACGAGNRQKASFCRWCATKLPDLPPPPPPPRRTARLVHIKDQGRILDIYRLADDETVIGRTRGDIVFGHDRYLSGRHASIIQRNGKYYLLDNGSSNGTYLRIRDEMELRSGDILRAGRQILRFEVELTDPDE